jgi:hypothetical protein
MTIGKTMSQETASTPDQQQRIIDLLMRLGSANNADRWTAQTELRKLPPVPLPLLLTFMVRLARIRRQAPFLLFLGLLTSGILLLGLLLIFDHLFGRSSHLLVLCAGIAGVALMMRRWLVMRDTARRALANYNDIRAVGPLLEHLSDEPGDRETRKIARELLLHLLPRVQPLNAELLTTEQQEALQRLIDGDDADLKAAAQRCSQAATARRTRERVRGSLLRVIAADETQAELSHNRDLQSLTNPTQGEET